MAPVWGTVMLVMSKGVTVLFAAVWYIKRVGAVVAIMLVGGGGAPALAQEVKNPIVAERMRLMSDIGAASKILGDMVSGRTTFDQARAAQAAETLTQLSGRMPDAFAAPETDPASDALPSIWQNWSAFSARAETLHAAVKSVDPSSTGSLRAGLADIGGACRACHTNFRR